MNTFNFHPSLGNIELSKFIELLNSHKVLRFRAIVVVHTFKDKRRIGEFEIADLDEVKGKTLLEEVTDEITKASKGYVNKDFHPSRVVLEVQQIIYK